MNFLDLANNRYTTKNYNADKEIPTGVIEELKEILRLSPSSINGQPWKFFFVSDETVKKQLADASYWNAQKIKDANCLVVFTALDNIEQFEKQINEHLPAGSVNYYNTFLKPLGEQNIRSWMQQQVYLSLGFFLAACASMRIDSTPMEGIQNDVYDRILELKNHKTLFAVALGYRNSEDANQPSLNRKSRLPLNQVIASI